MPLQQGARVDPMFMPMGKATTCMLFAKSNEHRRVKCTRLPIGFTCCIDKHSHACTTHS
jgi:hypothetical protein